MNNLPVATSLKPVFFTHADIQTQLQNLLSSTSTSASASATIDALDAENLDQVARIITNIHLSNQQEAFLNHLNQFIAKKESEIEAQCRGHYQDFLSSVDQLLNVRQAAVSLKTKVSTHDASIQSAGSALREASTTLLDTRKVLGKIQETIQLFESCLQLLDLSKKLIVQIDQFKFYSGLRLIDEIKFQNCFLLKPNSTSHHHHHNHSSHTVTNNHKKNSVASFTDFSNYLSMNFLDHQINKIRDQVIKQLNTWLYEARQQSRAIGKRAIEGVLLRERRWKARKERFFQHGHPASLALLGNLNTPVEAAVSERHDYGLFNLNPNPNNTREEEEDQEGARNEQLIDFSPLYLAIHIHDTLDRKEELKKSFRDDRRAQAHLIISSIPPSLTSPTTNPSHAKTTQTINPNPNPNPNPSANSNQNTNTNINPSTDGFNLDSLGSLIETIIGFFMIETQILRTTTQFRDQDEVEELWEDMSRRVVLIVQRFVRSHPHDLDVLLGVRNHLVMFSKSLEACEYSMTQVTELLNKLSEEFVEKLRDKFAEDFEQFVLEDDHLLMMVNNPDEFDKVTQVSFLPHTGIWCKAELAKLSYSSSPSSTQFILNPPSTSAPHPSQPFPAALPFSAAYPLCCISIRNYVTKHYAYCESIDREVDYSIKKALDSFLVSNVGAHMLKQIERTRNLSQLAQMVINALFFSMACDQLEQMLTELKVRGNSHRLELESKAMFSRILKTVELAMVREIEEKIQAFFDLSQYDWRRKTKLEPTSGTAAAAAAAGADENEASVYLKECLNFLENLIQNVLVLTPAEFNQNVFLGAWYFIGQRLQSILIDREPAAISDGGLSVLANDVHFAAHRLLHSHLATASDPKCHQLLLLFEGLVQTVRLLGAHDVATYLDLEYRQTKFPLVDPQKLPLMLVKLLTCMNSVGSSVDPSRKASVEEVIKQLSHN